jgi:hypothetical protein
MSVWKTRFMPSRTAIHSSGGVPNRFCFTDEEVKRFHINAIQVGYIKQYESALINEFVPAAGYWH